ncbi:hypothetical protein F4703DRAFT_1816773 [Phycomyces blakesleeanus]
MHKPIFLVTTLIELSRFRLSTIASTIVSVLEVVSKSVAATPGDDYIPNDILQSQLFLLRMLSACMQHHWEFIRTNKDSPADLPTLQDPPPLEDTLAKYMISIMSRFMHQMTVMEERDHGSATNITRTAYYSISGLTSLPTDIVVDIYKAASRVVFYLSASNWYIMHSKLRARILYLTTTSDEAPDTSDIRLLECCALNSKRLSMMFEELHPTFTRLKKSAQLAIAVILRRAIWGWIETYPSEFINLCRSKKRLDGRPDILFDICNSLADTTRKKAILWPLQTILLALCPDLMIASSASEGRGFLAKKTLFFNTLKKAIKGGRTAELAAICYVDICKAVNYVSKEETSSFKHLVPEIEKELKEKLFDIDHPLMADNLMNSVGIIIDHRYLLADTLVAMFRLNSRKAMQTHFPTCLDERAPTLFRLSLVKACLAIAMQENRLPWNPSISSLYSSLCDPLKRLFLETTRADPTRSETTSLSNRRPPTVGDKKVKKDKDSTHERLEMMLDMLRLYQADPNMAIRGNAEDKTEQNAAVMVAVTMCLRELNQAVRDAAAETLFKLHAPHYILEWGVPERFMESFWSISSQVIHTLAKQMIDTREREDSLKKLLDLLKKLLICRNEFLRIHQDIAMQGADVRDRLHASIALEVSLLVLLCSADTDICSAAIACFGHICIEAHITDGMDDPQQTSLTVAENLPIYIELTSNTGIVTGRKSQQKQIRRLLRMMSHYAPGNISAWEEAWKRWKNLTPSILRPSEEPKEDMSEVTRKTTQAWHDKLRNTRQQNTISSRSENLEDDRSSEWQNYAGFLAALGGICLMGGALPSSAQSPRHHEADPRRSSTQSESAAMADRFVMDMVDLLLCDNVILREWVKEILGTDLSPALYPMLFRHLETVLAKCFGPDGDPTCSPRYTLFVEQAISVLKFVLDRMEESADTLFTVDFSQLISQYAKYLNKLGSSQAALKIKIKFCQLCEVLMAKKEKVTLRQEFKLRNKLLEIIVEWTSDFSLKVDVNSHYSSFEQGEKLHRDLDLACLKTIVNLLHQLPLQPSEPVHETGASQVKSRMFYKYFTFFLKLLNRCRISEIQSDSRLTSRTADSMHSKNKDNATYLGPLKEYTILAMSNLLSANVDAGLKYSLSMGYHEDTRMRTAFMQVLTNILNQGTEFETLAETVMTDRYEKIIDMLVEPDLHIAMSLCNVCPATDIDDASNALLACFSSRGNAMTLLKAVIDKEVQNTENHTELFRRTSIATRLLSVFAKTYGAEYVQSVLQPVFHVLLDTPREERSFELDPSKVGPGEDVYRNRENVISVTQLFLNAICASSNEAPPSFRELCHHILVSVRERFPEAKNTAVGAFIFLRFFCPAIVSPESEGLIKGSLSISREMRRGHLIATKVIQNLANNMLFGTKETYMIVLNDFVTSNIYNVTKFLREISDISPGEEFEADIRQMEDKDYALLHRVLADNMERMTRDVATRRQRLFADTDTWAVWKRMFDKFSNLLAQLGRPPEIQKQEFSGLRSYTFAAANQVYAEFMRRNSHRSVDAIATKNIFYEGGTSKVGRPVLYIIARNISNDSIDFELFIYYMLQVLERTANKAIEVVFDLTLFGHANEIPNQWISQILQLLPSDVCDNVATFHIYNPNSHLRKYIKKLLHPITHKVSKRISFAVTLAELYESIHPSEVRLPKSTMTLDTEPSAVFYPVNHISQFKTNVPVTVKVGAEYVQIMTGRKQELLYGVSTVTNDVYRISEIEDIVLSPGRGAEVANEFSFKYDKGRLIVILSTIKREAIVSTIRHSKRCYEMSKPSNITERTIRPSDVPGRLLNMALLNIGSEDPNLRLASYNLLYALSKTFHFDVGKQLLDARDLCLPANSTAFIVGISEKLAISEPNLTLEFLNECFVGFNKSNEPMRYLCLDYMIAWLPNLAIFSHGSSDDNNSVKTKEVLRLLIDLTVTRADMYKLLQAKVWKTIGKVDDVLNLVLDTFVQFSSDHGVGSPQAESMADTFVTLSNVAVRGKVISRLRKVLQRTSFQPMRSLSEHYTWNEIAVLVRFILMLSFNNRGPVKSYIPEMFHIVSLVVSTGPILVRASVHGLVVNMIQSLCTAMPLPESNVKKLQLLLAEISDTKFRLLFGLAKPHLNPFTINDETLSDSSDRIQLGSLETIVTTLLDVLQYAAPSADMANVWRARWMSLVASTAFQFNPAIQPRALVTLGCIAREEVDDELLYQLLAALRGALAIFNETDPSLVLSIIMCLKNIVESLPPDSRYLSSLFWVAVSLVQINNGPTFSMAVELLLALLRALDANEYFSGDVMVDVLLAARVPMLDVARRLDQLCGVDFESHFSFAMSCVFMRGLQFANAKDTIYHALTVFLGVENKHSSLETDEIDANILGYFAGLLPMAIKNESLRDVLKLAGMGDLDLEVSDSNMGTTYHGIFDKMDIPDNTTALLLVSMLSTQLNMADNESERLFLYGLLAEAAVSMPDVFVSVYDTLLPKMNQILLNNNTQPIIESIKTILIIACSDPVFGDMKNRRTQKTLLEEIGFSSLGEANFGVSTADVLQNAMLASELIERIIS